MQLKKYTQQDQQLAITLIQQFWIEHNGECSFEDAKDDLMVFIGKDHVLYFIQVQQEIVGFVHLASRGGEINWLEHLFILKDKRHQGYGSKAIQLVEQMVQSTSSSLYMEVAMKNQKVLPLYHHLGYTTLNTITIRKDFESQQMEKIGEQTIADLPFVIQTIKKGE